MQVPVTTIVTYIKSKNPPRMATLTYSHFGNPGRSYPCARYAIVQGGTETMNQIFN